MMSEWREHPDHPTYWFSSDGKCAREIGGVLSPRIGTMCGIGYRAIDFRTGKKERLYIHRIICSLFNDGYVEGLHCRHLDCDLTNNRASNLAWGTAADNAKDSVRNGKTLFGEKNPMAKLSEEKVRMMREERELTGRPYYKIAKDFSVSTMTAFRAITRRAWA